MWLIERLRALVPPILECSRDPGEYLLHRIDGSDGGFALGTSLGVCANEHAMLVADRHIVNELGPGIYRLDRQQLAELDAIYSWPAQFNGPVRADVVFVSTLPHRRMVWECRMPGGTAVQALHATGTIDFSITDPKRFAAWHLERGHDDDKAVRRAIEGTVGSALRALVAHSGGPEGMADLGRDTARQLRKHLGVDMAPRGIGELSLRVRRLKRPPPAPAAASVNGAVEDSNVAQLPFERSVPRPAEPAAEGPAAPPPDPQSDEFQAIVDLEREIERLDAWSGIGVGAPGGEPPDTGGAGEVPAPDRCLPARFHGLNFYIAVNMEQTGPFDVAEFEQALREGVVDAHTLVWFQGMDDWRPAGDIPEVAALLQG